MYRTRVYWLKQIKIISLYGLSKRKKIVFNPSIHFLALFLSISFSSIFVLLNKKKGKTFQKETLNGFRFKPSCSVVIIHFSTVSCEHKQLIHCLRSSLFLSKPQTIIDFSLVNFLSRISHTINNKKFNTSSSRQFFLFLPFYFIVFIHFFAVFLYYIHISNFPNFLNCSK